MTFEIAMKIAHKMMKKLIMTGVIIALSMLIMQFNQTLGILLMMVYSSWMMLKSSKNEMPLSKFTAILPGAMALLCFLFIMGFMGVYRPIMPIAGIVIGIIPGFLKARGHRIYNKDGKVYAKKTYFYILIWTGSLLFTQGATLLGLRQIIEFGFLLNGFSTTMAVILSVFLFKKAKGLQKPTISTSKIINGLLLLVATLSLIALSVQPVEAYTVKGPMTVKKMDQIGKYVFQEVLLQRYAGARHSAGGHRDSENNFIFQGEIQKKIPLFYRYFDKDPKKKKPRLKWESIFYKIYYKDKKRVESLLKKFVRESKRDIVGQPTKDYYYYGHLLALDYNSLNTDDGERGLYFIKTTQDRRFLDSRDRRVSIQVFWIYKDWALQINYHGYPDNPQTFLGWNFKNNILNVTARARQRIKNLQVVPLASKPQPKPQPKPAPKPQPKPKPPVNTQTNQEDTKDDTDTSKPDQETVELASAIDKVLSAIEQSLQNFGFYGGAVAAGVAVALVQLLAGLGMSAATTAAYEVAFAVEGSINEGLQESDEQYASSVHTEMLDGAQAQQWLMQNGYLYENGLPTSLFQNWQNNPDQGDLHGIAGYEGTNGDMSNSVILVSRDASAQQEPEIQIKEQPSAEGQNVTPQSEEDQNKTQQPEGDPTKTQKVDSTEEQLQNTQQSDQKEIDDDRPPDVDRHDDELLPDEPQPEPYEPPGPTTPGQVAALKDMIQETIDNKKMEGYYVGNREFDVLPGVDQALWAANKAINNIGNWIGSPVDGAMGWTGGQCGEYGEWGIEWSKEACKDTFGEGTIMTQITAESSTSNHNATRVITPNGDRFVIDYWQGMQDKQTVYTEEEWIQQQTKAGRPDIVRSWNGDKAGILNGGEEGSLNKYINKYGEKEGLEKFRSGAGKGEDRAKREALILSYQKSPWPTK